MKRAREESIIEIVKDPPKITWADIHIAKIKGLSGVARNVWYRNTETGDVYSYIAGGIAWPGIRKGQGQVGAGYPGYAVVVVVEKSDEAEPKITTVAEAEHGDVYGLVDECVKLRERWGYWQSGEILREWWGDYERFLTFTGEINDRLQKRDGPENGFYMAVPIDFEQDNAFEIYLRRIQSCLIPGKKSLFLGSCSRLQNNLANVPADASRRSADEFPAIAALGFVLHSLKVLEPWKRIVEEAAQNMGVSTMEIATIESERELQRLEREDEGMFGDEEDEHGFANYGVKDTIDTIPGG